MLTAPQPIHVPRRELDLEDYIEIARRQKAWILGLAFAGLVVAVVTAFLWPDAYVSTALVHLRSPKVPESYVPSDSVADAQSRMQALSAEIMTRNVMKELIERNNLYPGERRSHTLDEVIQTMMSKDIQITPVKKSVVSSNTPVRSYTISVRYEDPRTAQKICQQIVSMLTSHNLRTRSVQAESTTTFLSDQYESAKRDLLSIEQKIAAFRSANQGSLPEQMQSALGQLQRLEARLAPLQAAAAKSEQDKLLLDAKLTTLKQELRVISAPVSLAAARASFPDEQKLQALETDISQQEILLSNIRERYTAAHPDVQQQEKTLAWLKKQRDGLVQKKQAFVNEAAQKPAAESITAEQKRQVQELQEAVTQTELAIRGKDLEAQTAETELRKTSQAMQALQGRISAMPLREPAYNQMMQEREAALERMKGLERNKAVSESATRVEERKQGENLELFESPSLPRLPVYPNRWLIIGAGASLGLLLGIAAAGFREVQDTTLKSLKDVRAYTSVAILSSIPLLEDHAAVATRSRLERLGWITAIVIGVALMSASFAYYMSVTGRALDALGF